LKPTQQVCTIAVDVGNTAVKLAVRKENAITHTSISIQSDCWATAVIQWAGQQVECKDLHWIVSSVHRKAAESLIECIHDLGSVTDGETQTHSVRVVGYQDIPMPVQVDDPRSLGIDRLLSAFAATRIVGKLPPDSGLVVIDAGSAITVDWVDSEGCFRGGAILPGLRLQAKALATGTDALPEIDWQADQDVCLPGTNTADAIFGGILVGAAGAIDAVASRYRMHGVSDAIGCVADAGSEIFDAGGKMFDADGGRNQELATAENQARNCVVLTGGDAPALSRHLRCPHRHVENLVCHGLLTLGEDETCTSSRSYE
jgi:type III pantothenate kinase